VRARRWEGDERGHGVADGARLAPGVQRLLAAMARPGWVAEDPDAHLLPQLRAAWGRPGSPWTLRSVGFDGALYRLTVDWAGQPATLRQLRADAFALIGAIAEGATNVYQRVLPTGVDFEVATGLLEEQTPFGSHGHLLRLCVTGAAAERVAAAAGAPTP
jgi:hypothetical protein